MRYVPTITGCNTNKLDFTELREGDEVLLTPSLNCFQPPPGEFGVIVDNGCFVVNMIRRNDQEYLENRMLEHITFCSQMEGRDRIVFVLPDVQWSEGLSEFWIRSFLDYVKPKRFALVDWPAVMASSSHLVDQCEFLCTARGKHMTVPDPMRYHFLGRFGEDREGRSWDDVKWDRSISLKENIRRRSSAST